MRRFTAATTLTHNLFPLKRQNRPEAVLCKYKYAAVSQRPMITTCPPPPSSRVLIS